MPSQYSTLLGHLATDLPLSARPRGPPAAAWRLAMPPTTSSPRLDRRQPLLWQPRRQPRRRCWSLPGGGRCDPGSAEQFGADQNADDVLTAHYLSAMRPPGLPISSSATRPPLPRLPVQAPSWFPIPTGRAALSSRWHRATCTSVPAAPDRSAGTVSGQTELLAERRRSWRSIRVPTLSGNPGCLVPACPG